MIKLFQVSDIHFKSNHTTVDRVERLIEDIKLNIKSEDRAYLLITGDIVNVGDDNLYNTFISRFILPATDLFLGIVTCPGNHDVQRSKSNPSLIDKLSHDADMSYIYDRDGNLSLTCPFPEDTLENYFSFANIVTSPTLSNYYGSRHEFPDLSIVALNTTWLSRQRDTPDTDRGRLRIDPPAIQSLSHELPNDRLRVALLHHPLDWIVEDSRQDVEKLITSNFDMLLYGHVHSQSTISGKFAGGRCFMHQAPTLLSRVSRGANAYTIIKVDHEQKKYKITYRSYSVNQGKFISGADICQNGILYPSEEDRAFWEHRGKTSTDEIVESFKAELSQCDFSNWHQVNTPPKTKTTPNFVEPTFCKVIFSNGERQDSSPVELCNALSTIPHRVFFTGPTDSGLSTSAFISVKHISENSDVYELVPVYINVANFAVNRASILGEAVKTCPVPLSHSQIEALANSGLLLFVLDGVMLPNTVKFNHVLETLDRYFEKCKAILFCPVDGPSGEVSEQIELRLDPNLDAVYEIQQLGTASIRKLVGLHFPDRDDATRDSLVEHIVQSFRGMDEPIYASSTVLLIDTLKQIPDYKPINRIRLLDRYVEVLLGRLEVDDIRTGSFSSTDKIAILSYLAGYFAKTLVQCLRHSEWPGFVGSYARDKLLSVPSGLLDEFVSKGILLNQGGSIIFRADYLFSYFVAREMHQNSELRHFILDGDNFFSFHKEIAAYGELEGVDNFALIEGVKSRLDTIEEKVLETYSLHHINLDSELDGLFRADDSLQNSSKLEDSANSLSNLPDCTKIDDGHLDGELHGVERARGVLPRHAVRNLESRWLNTLLTYLKLLKHSENLAGKEKVKHVTAALEAGELFVKTLAFKRDFIAKHPAVVLDGILYLNPLARSAPEKSISEFKYNAPMSFGRLIQENLSNPKLAPVFRIASESDSEMIKYFTRRLLLDHSNSDNANAYLDSILNSSEIVLQTCSLRELRRDYITQSHSAVRKGFLKSVVDGIASSKTLGRLFSKRELEKRMFLAKMREAAKENRKSDT